MTCSANVVRRTAHQRLQYPVLSLPGRRQILATFLLPQAFPPTMVSHRRLHQHVPRGRLQYRPHLPFDLYLHASDEELRRLHHSRILP